MPSRPDADSPIRTGGISSRAGFTLMELVVSSLLISIVLAGIYSAFSTALRTSRIGEAGMRNYQSARIATAVFEQELQCVVTGSEHLFEGEDDEVLFYSLASPMDVEEGEYARVMQVRYRTKEDRHSRDKILVREEAIVDGPLPVPEPGREDDVDSDTLKLKNKESFELASGIKDVEISYYWARPKTEESAEDAAFADAPPEFLILEENDKGWGLPQAVKMVMTVADPNDEDEETTFTTFVAFQGPTTPLSKSGVEEVGL